MRAPGFIRGIDWVTLSAWSMRDNCTTHDCVGALNIKCCIHHGESASLIFTFNNITTVNKRFSVMLFNNLI